MIKKPTSKFVILSILRSKSQLALYTAALLPELQPVPCFLSAIIGQTD